MEVEEGIVDLRGAFVLPGLVDAHAHLHGTGHDPAAGDVVRERLAVYLSSGVTTIREAGARGATALELARGTSMPLIQTSGWPIRRPVAVTDAITSARALAHAGATWLKAYELSPPELTGVLAVGRETGLRVGAHLGDDPKASMDMGVEAVEHVYTLVRHDLVSDEARRSPLIADADRPIATWALTEPTVGAEARWYETVGRARPFVTPTLLVMRALQGRPAGMRWGVGAREAPWATAAERARWKRSLAAWGWWKPGPGSSRELRARAFENLGRTVRSLADAGCRICVGTDFGEPFIEPGVGVLDEMRVLRAAGLSTLDVIRGATSVAAALLGLDGVIGKIIPGARADLLVVGQDPLDMLEAIAEPILVMAAGRVVVDRRGEPGDAAPGTRDQFAPPPRAGVTT